MTEPTNDRPHLLTDVPITRREGDRLDRTPFAESLAHSVLSLKGDDSFVFGLCGPWGSGKTSVLNIFVGTVEDVEEENRPIVVRFNPWWFSGRHQLLESFLGQFAAAVELPDKGAGAEKTSTLFRRLSIGLRPFSFIPGLREIGKVTSDVARSVADIAAMYVDATRQDVYLLRHSIDDALRKLDRKIIVIMDDIDRLAADEIAEIFLILKAVADFPNTVYVLAFDHKVVRRAIQKKLGVDGKAYLEKIVQLQVDLPTVGYTGIHKLFLEQVGQLFDEAEMTQDIRRDLGNLFHDGVKDFLTTPRASKRLLNTLRFIYPPLKGEVYFPDLLGVATLFTFAPTAVPTIASNADAFTGAERYGDNKDKLADFHNGWLEKLEPGIRSSISGIVKRLFPRCEWALDGHGYASEFEVIWRRKLRVCSSSHFEKYFLLGLPSGVVSEAEWSQIVDLMVDGEQFERTLLAMTGQPGRHGFRSRCKELLDRLEDYAVTSNDAKRIKTVFTSVLKLGDRLIAVKDEEVLGGLLPWDNETRVLRVLLRCLENVSDEKVRMALLDEGVRGESGLLTLTELVYNLGRQHGMCGSQRPENRRSTPLLSEDNVQRLMRRTNRKILATAKGDAGGILAQNPFCLNIVRNWCHIGSEKEAVRWLRRQAKQDKFMVDLLRQASSKTRSHGLSDHVARETLTVNTSYLGGFLNLKQLKRRCVHLLDEPPEWLTEDQKELLRITDSHIGDSGEALDERDMRNARIMSGEAEGDDE